MTCPRSSQLRTPNRQELPDEKKVGTKTTFRFLPQRLEFVVDRYRVAQESKLPYFGFEKILFLVKIFGRTSKRLERAGCSGPQGLRTRP